MRMHYYAVAGLANVGFSTENDAGVEQSARTTVGVTESPPGRYTVDVAEGLTVNWYEGTTYIVSERAERPLPAASYVAPDNAGIAAVKAKTDTLPATPASKADADAATAAASAAKASADLANRTEPDNAGIAAAVASAASADGKLPADTATKLGRLDIPVSQAREVPEEWVAITEATLDDQGAALGPIDSAAVLIVAYADSLPIASTRSEGDGGFRLHVPPGATYSLQAHKPGTVYDRRMVTVP